MARFTGQPVRYSTRVTAVLLLIATTLLPAAASAAPAGQAGGLDPAVLAAIQSGAAAVYRSMPAPVRTAQGSAPEPVPTEEAAEEPTAEATPEPTDEPTTEPTAEPTAEPTEEAQAPEGEVEAENAGVNMLVPARWEVTPGEGELVFDFADPGRNFEGMLNTFTDFPGLILFPVLERNPDLFAQSMGPDTVVEEISRFDVEQSVPALRLTFSNADNGTDVMDGAIFIYGPGDAVYMMIAGAPSDEWPALAEEVNLAAASILFDEAIITLQTAGDEGLQLEDEAGRFGFTAPAGWLASTTNVEEMPFTFADPDVTVIGLAGMPPTDDTSAFEQALSEAAAARLSDESARELVKEAMAALEIEEDGLAIDEALTEVFVPASGSALLIVRVGGDADLGDGLILPMMIYAAVHSGNVLAFVFIGDPADVLGMEEAVLQMVESASPLQ